MLTTLPAGAPQDEIFSTLDRDGGVIVSDFLSDAMVDGLLEDFDPHLEEADWGDSDSAEPNDFFGLTTKRLHGLVSKSARMQEIVSHPLLLAMARTRLGVGERCFDMRISTAELMAIGPGEKQQSLHRDADAWQFVPLSDPRPEILVSANIALHDFTEANGATVVIPGSHKWPKDRKAEADQMGKAIMKRGSALLYSGEVVHGGGANVTEGVRCGLYVGYIASWLRPTENHLQTNDPGVIEALPEDIQQLYNVVPNGFSLIA